MSHTWEIILETVIVPGLRASHLVGSVDSVPNIDVLPLFVLDAHNGVVLFLLLVVLFFFS